MRHEAVARGVAPDAAWAWWTDYREGPGDHAAFAWANPVRRVEPLPGGGHRITEEATFLRLRFREVTEVAPAKPRIRFEARNDLGRFRGHFRFLPHPEGTRIEVVWDQELVRWLRWLGPLGRLLVRWFYAWDMKHHVRAMEREAASLASAGPQTL